MFPWGDGQVTFEILQMIPDNPAFNYAFTLVAIAGVIGTGIAFLLRVVSRS